MIWRSWSPFGRGIPPRLRLLVDTNRYQDGRASRASCREYRRRLMAEFSSVVDAVRCAVDVQRRRAAMATAAGLQLVEALAQVPTAYRGVLIPMTSPLFARSSGAAAAFALATVLPSSPSANMSILGQIGPSYRVAPPTTSSKRTGRNARGVAHRTAEQLLGRRQPQRPRKPSDLEYLRRAEKVIE